MSGAGWVWLRAGGESGKHCSRPLVSVCSSHRSRGTGEADVLDSVLQTPRNLLPRGAPFERNIP